MRSPVRSSRFHALLGALALCGACGHGDPPLGTAPSAPGASAASLEPWSREGFSAPSATLDAGLAPTLTTADPDALAALLAAAPQTQLSPTGKGGKTAIGTDTGIPASATASEAAPQERAPQPQVSVGELEIQAQLASPAIERAARAQLYWNLVQRCRDPQGKILPPDAIHLRFHVDADGHIAAASIQAMPNERRADSRRYTDAAHCMRRELARSGFRAPAAARGIPSLIDALVPSVD